MRTGEDMTTEEIRAVLTDYLFGRITMWDQSDRDWFARYVRELGEELDRRQAGESPEPVRYAPPDPVYDNLPL